MKAQALEEVAMAFCRDCLGWKKAEWSGNTRDELMWINAPGGSRFLRFDDLNAVMAAFRAFLLEKHPGWLWSIERCPGTDVILVTIEFPDDGRVDKFSEDMRHALMAACVEAVRKRKESQGG